MASGRSVLASTPPTFSGVAFKSRSVWSFDIENTQTVLPTPTFGAICLSIGHSSGGVKTYISPLSVVTVSGSGSCDLGGLGIDLHGHVQNRVDDRPILDQRLAHQVGVLDAQHDREFGHRHGFVGLGQRLDELLALELGVEDQAALPVQGGQEHLAVGLVEPFENRRDHLGDRAEVLAIGLLHLRQSVFLEVAVADAEPTDEAVIVVDGHLAPRDDGQDRRAADVLQKPQRLAASRPGC